MDQELKQQLERLNTNNELIASRLGSNYSVLLRGLITGFGSALGALIAITLLGFILNVVGVIPAFRYEVERWRDIIIQKP